MTIAFIYKITNLKTLEIYVGKTFKTPEKRFKEHLRASAKTGKTRLCINIREHGTENFKTEVIAETTCPQAKTREREFIAQLKPTLNMNKGGGGGDGKWITNGVKTYKIARLEDIPAGFVPGRKMKRAQIYITDGKTERLIFADEALPDGFSRGRNESTRKAISNSKMGNMAHLGCKHTAASKQLMSQAHIQSHSNENRKPYPAARKTAAKNKITVNGIEYLSKHHACVALGIGRRTLLTML